ncbi:MAG: hypothetical protein H0V01_09040 [Bacteroidetes bacterium]|nr:hypothetical protein [Bacteroidota bacterium]HET6244636.1 hypothetical protein [Bacteroidia bacterium]
MKIFSTMLILILLLMSNLYAQRPVSDPKHENHYSVETIETDDLVIEFKNAHSQHQFTIVNVNIKNKSSDYIYFKGSESKFKYAHGDYSPVGSLVSKIDFFIEPNGSASKTLKVSGDSKFHVEQLKLELSGFYRINPKGDKTLTAADFQLPASKNSFSAGDCNCSLEKSSQTTKETSAKFNCKYQGKDLLILDPTKLSVKVKKSPENIFANDNRKDKAEIIFPGGDYKFTAEFHIPGKTADMQFSVLDVVWNDTFVQAKMIPIKIPSVNFVFDDGMTLLKNQ